MSLNQNPSEIEEESIKIGNSIPKQEQRKKRRKRVDEDGRDYTCACGKSYLSYPALYTHVKTKHNQQSTISQNLKLPSTQTEKIEPNKQQLAYSKSTKIIKKDSQQEQFSIENLKQFLIKQFIRQKTQQNLIELKNHLKLQQEQALYINHILYLAENIQTKFQDQNKNFYSNSKSEINSALNTKQDTHEMANAFQSSPQFKRYGQINIIKNILEKNQKDKTANHIEKRGFTPCLFPIQQLSRKNIRKQQVVIDELLGMFLSDFLKAGHPNEISGYVMTYFLCKIRQFFKLNFNDKATCEMSCQSLIEQSNNLVGYLTELQNPYIRQPIVVCKILFFMLRWMFKHQLTEKLVKFNQAGF